MPIRPSRALRRAARVLDRCGALLVATGAGMGVDSGLPDFRGPGGVWGGYTQLPPDGVRRARAATPQAFLHEPQLAWRLLEQRRAHAAAVELHDGYAVVARWLAGAGPYGFAVTSNVYGHLQRAGVDEARLLEVHGSHAQRQCLASCGQPPWPAPPAGDDVPAPRCPACGGPARPGTLLLGDFRFDSTRTDRQNAAYARFCGRVDGRRLAIVEIGAGTVVRTIRSLTSQLAACRRDVTLIRVNPATDDEACDVHVAAGGRDGLVGIDRLRGTGRT